MWADSQQRPFSRGAAVGTNWTLERRRKWNKSPGRVSSSELEKKTTIQIDYWSVMASHSSIPLLAIPLASQRPFQFVCTQFWTSPSIRSLLSRHESLCPNEGKSGNGATTTEAQEATGLRYQQATFWDSFLIWQAGDMPLDKTHVPTFQPFISFSFNHNNEGILRQLLHLKSNKENI